LRVGSFEVCPDADYIRTSATVKRNPNTTGNLFVGVHSLSQYFTEAFIALPGLLHHKLGTAGAGQEPVAHLESVGTVVQNDR